MLKYLFTLLFLAGIFTISAAEKFSPKKNDVVVFAGDSITHQCMYTQYIENFLYTRFHDINLHTFNSGISGDKAIDLLNRFEEDLAFQKPHWVTILLGMNDGRYKAFEQENFNVYKRDMSIILNKLKDLQAVSIVMTPTMFDQQQYRIRSKDKNFQFNRLNTHPDYNAKLGMYAGFLRSSANDRDLNLVDFWGPMNDITAYFRQSDPNFTLSPDSIHPAPGGQAVMAVQMAAYFAGASKGRKTFINVNDSQHSKDVTELQTADNTVTAKVTPEFLPWVLPDTNQPGPAPYLYPDNPMPGFKKAMSIYDFNNETLSVSGLKPGKYDVLMNDEKVFSGVSSEELTVGLSLQFVKNSPTYKQALAVAVLNEKRNTQGMRPYRNIQGRMKGARRKFADKEDELKKFREKLLPDLQKVLKIADDYEKEIHALAVPKSYTLRVEPAK